MSLTVSTELSKSRR